MTTEEIRNKYETDATYRVRGCKAKYVGTHSRTGEHAYEFTADVTLPDGSVEIRKFIARHNNNFTFTWMR